MSGESDLLLAEIRDAIVALHTHLEDQILLHTTTVDTHLFLGLLQGVTHKDLGEPFGLTDTVAIGAGDTKTITFENPADRYRFIWAFRFDSEVSAKIQADVRMDGGVGPGLPNFSLKYLCPAFRTDLHTPMHAHNVPIRHRIACTFTNNDAAEKWAMFFMSGIQTTPEVYEALLKVHILGFMDRIERTYGNLPGRKIG